MASKSITPSIAGSKAIPRAPSPPLIPSIIPPRTLIRRRRRPSGWRVPPIPIRLRWRAQAAPPLVLPLPYRRGWRGPVAVIVVGSAVRGPVEVSVVSSLSRVSVPSSLLLRRRWWRRWQVLGGFLLSFVAAVQRLDRHVHHLGHGRRMKPKEESGKTK
jgi:hypothetical protein